MKTIVIVGGGAGGLELATQLGHKLGITQKAKVVLIDKNRTHIWKPLLHEVATGSFDSHLDAVVYHAHSARHGYQFRLGALTNIDKHKKHVTLTQEGADNLPFTQTLNYDYLVLATGSISNDFNIPGVGQHCFFLDSHLQAEKFHHELLAEFTRMQQQTNPGTLDVAVVGAGATGVELSAELFHVSHLLKSYGFENLSEKQLHINLIEAGSRILPALPQRISACAHQELEKLGVTVRANTQVAKAEKDGFTTNQGDKIHADLMIWAAGVKAPDFISNMGIFEQNKAGQILVNPDLSSTVDQDIYVIGDSCGFRQQDGSWVPPRAQSAHQMASQLQKNIRLRLQGKPQQAYEYVDYGSLVNLSRFSTVGSLMGNLTKNSMFIEGKLARLMYISLYRMHQMAIHGKARAMLLWVAEKLVKVVRPKMKLH